MKIKILCINLEIFRDLADLRFNLVLTPEGSVLLNDEDLSGLFVQMLLPETK